MQCEERNKLLKDYDEAAITAVPYPASTNGVPQTFSDVLHAELLQRTLHTKSVALEEHDKAHHCTTPQAK
jgi:hypothetical protein